MPDHKSDVGRQMPGSAKKWLPGQLSWLWLTTLIIVLDQWTKHEVVAVFTLYERLEVFPHFNLTLAYNLSLIHI